MSKKLRSIAVQLVIFFIIAISIPTFFVAIASIKETQTSMNKNMEITSEQTLQETQKGFTTYLKTLSQPVDLLTRKNEVKHLEDQGDFDTNVAAIQDSLIASVKVTSGAKKAYFVTKTGYLITGWTELNESTGKLGNKKSLETGVKYTNKSWYTSAIGSPSRNGIYAQFSEPYADTKTGDKVITVSQEIKYSSGENYGCVAMDIDFTEIKEYVQNISLLNTGYVLLVNENGGIIVDNDKNTLANSVDSLKCWDSIKSLSENQYDTVCSFNEKLNGDNMHIVASKDAVTGWTLMGFVSESETTSVTNRISKATAIASIFSFVAGIILAVVVTRTFTKEIKKINIVMNGVAAGDLTQRIEIRKKNEFGVLEGNFNNMVDNVASLIKNVEEKSEVIIKASENISDISKTTTETTNQVSEAIQSVSIGAAGQAESTNIANGEVENLAEKLHETKAYVSDINDMSNETKELSGQGLEIVDVLIDKAKKSMDNSKISKDVVTEMVSSIEKINFISDAITDITEQTNLLSLNASIEAARAGEAGKGFAVVADEIRKLAEQSQQSTEEIKKIAMEITEKSQLVKRTLDESNELINEQNISIQDTKELFNTITNAVTSLTEGLENISKLNDEMDSSRVNVVEKMEDVASISTQTAAASEEVTASAEEVNATMHNLNQCTVELDEIASALKEAIDQFKLD
ncbi:MAG: methyl-accepting chemotaxis protein [Eubacteriales bacterium]|nr:methyl-accepting chemotaxis protein [Eubacteriales bacterium]